MFFYTKLLWREPKIKLLATKSRRRREVFV